MYIHERKDWPNFTWDEQKVMSSLLKVRHLQGRLLGRMDALGFEFCEEAVLQVLTQDVLKTSEIEGEKLDTLQVRSSLAKRLGIDIGAAPRIDRNVDGMVEVMLDATQQFNAPLTVQRLFDWHAAIFPTGRSGLQHITVGGWRTKLSGPMQVVSGPYGREKVHYEAPSYKRLKKEIDVFIKWFNKTDELDLVVKSAIAHFWFVTIHPFEDGNGRIARVIADMLLARSEKSDKRFYSMSAQIQRERNAYYDILENTQKGSLNITLWLEWYLNCLHRAMTASDEVLETVLTKAQFWRKYIGEIFNERQRRIINRLLDGFEGKLNSSKWAKITKCSQDTALRDINDLVNRQILLKEEAGGRSTSYQLAILLQK